MRDAGELLRRGQVDRRAVESRALREALRGVARFTGEAASLNEVRSSLQALMHRSSATID